MNRPKGLARRRVFFILLILTYLMKKNKEWQILLVAVKEIIRYIYFENLNNYP
jgi:abortive infection bacteriophage resistance protein